MQTLLLLVAACTLLFCLYSAVEMALGSRTIAKLEDIPPLTIAAPPRISVVIAACNEEGGIEQALTSVLHQDYPDYEVIVVNDRSTDRTGEILHRMAQTNPRLQLITIHELPPAWLGKNHALHQGAARASGSFLLFTDADVVMDPSVLSRAVHYILDHGVDHLAIPPHVVMKGFLLNAFLGTFALIFNMYVQPWKAKNPKSAKHVGIGAFNMVRTAVYRTVGGHGRIAMRPDDDMKLGKLLKDEGYKQDMVIGAALISVEWYETFRQMVQGLMKNMFAGVEYSVVLAIAGSAVQILIGVWPFAALLLTHGWVQILNALIVAAILILYCASAGPAGIRRTYAFTYPFAVVAFCYILLRSMTVTLWTGGINWRGTHYPLSQLRAKPR
jgi:cellulose synthase/poly-beta-1,6-N-acetylglucosamine synthase-like glycosyltransferase